MRALQFLYINSGACGMTREAGSSGVGVWWWWWRRRRSKRRERDLPTHSACKENNKQARRERTFPLVAAAVKQTFWKNLTSSSSGGDPESVLLTVPCAPCRCRAARTIYIFPVRVRVLPCDETRSCPASYGTVASRCQHRHEGSESSQAIEGIRARAPGIQREAAVRWCLLRSTRRTGGATFVGLSPLRLRLRPGFSGWRSGALARPARPAWACARALRPAHTWATPSPRPRPAETVVNPHRPVLSAAGSAADRRCQMKRRGTPPAVAGRRAPLFRLGLTGPWQKEDGEGRALLPDAVMIVWFAAQRRERRRKAKMVMIH